MSPLRRYWRLWRQLPPEERRRRAGRVRDRWLRRDPRIRALGLAPDEPRWSSLRRALVVPLDDLPDRLRADDTARGPLFGDLESRVHGILTYRKEHANRTLAIAGRALDGRFDLLGSGPSRPIRDDGNPDWHLDWRSGTRWPERTHYSDQVVVRGDGSDVKIPWELSRCQHLLALGQAHWFDGPGNERSTRYAQGICRHIDDWIARNPRGLGINWACAMEVAIRATNWIAAFALVRRSPAVDDAFILRLVRSLWIHARHVRQNLETRPDTPTTNHYLADLVGLLTIGCALPELREAEDWKVFAWREIVRQGEIQVHADGASYERSLPYHRLVLEMLLHATILARGAGLETGGAWTERLSAMLEFTATCTRPDGTVPQWGDNDDGRWLPLDGYSTAMPHDHRHVLAVGGSLLDRDDLRAAGGEKDVEARWLGLRHILRRDASAAGTGSSAFCEVGYYVLRSDDLHSAVSCGPVGTAGLGNHSHDDLLSLVICAGGLEWIPDPGTGSYTGDPALRNLLRDVSSHATLQLGDSAQNAPGEGLDGLFVLKDRARPQVCSFTSDERQSRVSALHRGFSRPECETIHHRTVDFEPARRMWTVLDEVTLEHALPENPNPEPLFLRWPLHPDASWTIVEATAEWPSELRLAVDTLEDVTAGAPDRIRVAVRLEHDSQGIFWIGEDLPRGSRIEVVRGVYSARYGLVEDTHIVTATVPADARVRIGTVLMAPANHP